MRDPTEVLAAHELGEDWHCRCGEDMFGGSAAYAILLHRAHVASQILAHLRAVAADEGVRERVAVGIYYAEPRDASAGDLADAALAAFLDALEEDRGES